MSDTTNTENSASASASDKVEATVTRRKPPAQTPSPVPPAARAPATPATQAPATSTKVPENSGVSAAASPVLASTTPQGSGNVALGTPVHQVTDPTQAVAELKAKVGTLHTVVNNVGHFSTLAVDDVEALIADIGKLANFIRSKV